MKKINLICCLFAALAFASCEENQFQAPIIYKSDIELEFYDGKLIDTMVYSDGTFCYMYDYTKPMFVYAFNEDSIVNSYTYGKYLNTNDIDSSTRIVDDKYICFHDIRNCKSVICNKKFIWDLIVGSQCTVRVDTSYGSLYAIYDTCSIVTRTYYFDKAQLSFTRDGCEGFITKSEICIDGRTWCCSWDYDTYFETSSIETMFEDFANIYVYESLDDSLVAYEYIPIPIFYHDNTYLKIPHYVRIWDIVRKFECNGNPRAIIQNNNVSYYSADGEIIMEKTIGSKNIELCIINDWVIDDKTALEILTNCLIEKLGDSPLCN